MDDKRLDVIRAMWQAQSMNPAGAAFRELIAEVERLRAEEYRLHEKSFTPICPRCGNGLPLCKTCFE